MSTMKPQEAANLLKVIAVMRKRTHPNEGEVLEMCADLLNSRDDWRPMSEAPRDGPEAVILCRHGNVYRAAFSRGHWRAMFPDVEICVPEKNVIGWRPLNLPEGVE